MLSRRPSKFGGSQTSPRAAWIAGSSPAMTKYKSDLAMRFASELCEPRRARRKCPPLKGGGAPIGAPSMTARRRQVCANLRNSSAARQRLVREPLAFRRSAAALARANASAVGSAPVPAFPETRLDECYSLSPVSSLPSSSETGRRAGRAVAQSRPAPRLKSFNT
jgi:hypothetical protein